MTIFPTIFFFKLPCSSLDLHVLTAFFPTRRASDLGGDQLIEARAEFAPPPREQPATPRVVEPGDPAVSGFIFKVQANMNPQHRDRVAFMRLCSGRFRRGMKLTQVQTGKTIAVHSPIFFFAQSREQIGSASCRARVCQYV